MLGLDLAPALPTMSTGATILVLTVLLDLMDIWPQVASFCFVRTRSYAVYLLLRLCLAGIAALVIASTQPPQHPIILGLLATLGGILVLQNLTLTLANHSVINLAAVIQFYRDRMISEQAYQLATARQADALYLAEELLQQMPDLDMLKSTLQSVLFQNEAAGASQVEDIAQMLTTIDQQTGNDLEFRRRIYAGMIAQINPEYARTYRARRQAGTTMPKAPLELPPEPGSAATDDSGAGGH